MTALRPVLLAELVLVLAGAAAVAMPLVVAGTLMAVALLANAIAAADKATSHGEFTPYSTSLGTTADCLVTAPHPVVKAATVVAVTVVMAAIAVAAVAAAKPAT